ncbi:MAG: serine/threonine protein kinase, partial [Pyrinomonadaceae bacterium]|nr:serine/threonine protein kinase [Pyrinomonadaceae bacterium]
MKTCQKCGTSYENAQSFCSRDGEVLKDDHTEMVGRILDNQYEIEAFIAEGGMGAVFRARHTLLGDRVAIKILPPEMRRNAEWLKRFQREGQAARRFRHPNAVIVHDLRTSGEGWNYLVMEYVEGRTLDEEVKERGGRLAPSESIRIIEAVAGLLDAAHAQGVIHRDLKPSNIMLTKESGLVKVLDLGIAKISDLQIGETALTTAGQLLGTPYYMSPEQWGEIPRDGGIEIDGRADIYS